MSFEVTGKLYKIFNTVQVSSSFQKREFVLEVEEGNYPQIILFQATKDRCSIVDNLREGDAVKVHFDLRGREWTSPKGEVKYFTNLEAWKVESLSKIAPAAAATPPPAKMPTPPPTTSSSDFPSLNDAPAQEQSGGWDDLPF